MPWCSSLSPPQRWSNKNYMLVFGEIYTEGGCFIFSLTWVPSNQTNLAINITDFKVQIETLATASNCLHSDDLAFVHLSFRGVGRIPTAPYSEDSFTRVVVFMAKVYATGTQRRYIYANSLQGLEIEFYNFKNLEESSSVLLTSSHNSNINQATVSPILILHLWSSIYNPAISHLFGD